MAPQDDASARKRQRSGCVETQLKEDETMADADSQPPLNVPLQAINNATKGGPTGPSWSCRGCGRCNVHHTVSVPGCWACMQIMLNGPSFNADQWGDFSVCQAMKAARCAERK
jgi:hypothetical protein